MLPIRGRLTGLLLMAVVALSGCGGSGTTVGTGDPDLNPSDLTDVTVHDVPLDLGTVELAHKETIQELPKLDFGAPPDTGEVATDTGQGYGDWNIPCETNADCESSFCVQVADDQWVCTLTCVEECPEDWLCKGVQTGPDMAFICVPPKGNLCQECTSDGDCVYDKDRCLPVGNTGTYCTIDCAGTGECPEHFTCIEIAIDGEEETVFQCLPDTQSCICDFEADGTTLECSNNNEFGKCYGDQLCDGPHGWTECDAKMPGEETCDGTDENCDGVIDDGMAEKPCVKISEYGSCQGVDTCLGQGGWHCDADAPQAELCDGLDNNCNDEIDEEYDDTDGDLLADCIDLDDDGDAVPDEADNCPLTVNPDQANLDGDAQGNACDPDDDGDGIEDVLDNCPVLANSNQADLDGDGAGDECDDDIDGDGVNNPIDCQPYNVFVFPGAVEVCDGIDNNCNLFVDEGSPDADGDSAADCVDDDDDNDLDPDISDCQPLNPEVGHGLPETCDGLDNNCNEQIDEGFEDTDGDGVADCVDKDSDGDGVDDFQDNCPTIPNPGQANSDNDALGDACDTDDDNDGLIDDIDNCPLLANQDQSDIDGDLIGDVCDNDADGDNHPNALDCAPLDPNTYPGAPEICDGFDNNCNMQVDEGYPDSDNDNLADCKDPDDDGDLDPDVDDCAPMDPSIFNGAVEICDGVDSNCDGVVDEGCPAAALRLRQVNTFVEGITPEMRVHMVFGPRIGPTVIDEQQEIKLHWSRGY